MDKKIYYIVNARIPTEKAHGYQICTMCEKFSNLGVDVELFFPDKKNNIKEDVFGFYKIKENFKIRKIKNYDFFLFGKRIGFYLNSLFFIISLFFLKIDKDSIVYTRNPGVVWVFSLRKFKTVYECHDWFSRSKKLSLFLLRKCKKIITTNNYIKNEFLKNGFRNKNLLVAPNGIDLEIFDLDLEKKQAIEQLEVEQDLKNKMLSAITLLYTGSFTTMGSEKGIDEILNAIKGVNEVIFIAVGGSKKDINLYKDLLKNLGVDNAFFLERVEQKELAIFQKASDIMLMPFPNIAHYRYFMTPLKMFEYMASRRPIIASSLPSIKEILSKDNCLFCEPGDIDDLSKKIQKIIKDKDLARKISENAYNDVKQYSWDKRAKKIIDEFI